MATITVVDGLGVNQTVAKVAATGSATGANSLPVVIASDQGTITTQLPTAIGNTTKAASLGVALAIDDVLVTLVGAPSIGAQTIVASSASDVTILASNNSRKGAYIYNDSTQVLYLLLANAVSSTTVFTQKMAAGDSFSMSPGSYTGIIKGIWASANGAARVTEWS